MSIFTEDLQIQNPESDYFEPCSLNFRGDYSSKMYELTLTYKPKLWTLNQAYSDNTFLERLFLYLSQYSVDYVYVVKEYQTNTFFPHLHLAIEMTDSQSVIPKGEREKFTKECFKDYGRMTFCDLRKGNEVYENYLNKDLLKNFKKSGVCHYRIFTKN